MEFTISIFNKSSFSAVTVSHKDEHTLTFNCSGYSNTAPGAVVVEDEIPRVELFREVNEFIRTTLTEDEQLRLYECYARLEGLFQDFYPITPGERLEDHLRDEVARIYEIIRFDTLREHIVYEKKFKLPPELSDEYVTEDRINPLYQQRTCRLSEYIDLVAMAMGLRFMIPVWGSYIPIAAKESKPLKEYNAYQLLVKSDFFDSPGFNRLDIYVRANLPEDEYDLAVTFKHLSSEEIPTYLLALVVIRKLSVAPLSAETEKHHLMKIIYNYAIVGKTKTSRLPIAQGSRISDKKAPGEVNADDNSSVWCIFKMKEQISVGELETLQHYISEYERAAKAIEPNINTDKLAACIETALKLDSFRAMAVQKGLGAWVLSTVIPGIAVDMFDRRVLMIALGTAQTVLWEWGFNQLGILLTASIIKLDEDEMSTPVSFSAISRTKMETMDNIYPYPLPSSRRDEGIRSPNPGVRGVETIASEFIKNDWKPNCPKSLAASYQRTDISRRLEVSSDIRDQLTSLLIRLDQYVR